PRAFRQSGWRNGDPRTCKLLMSARGDAHTVEERPHSGPRLVEFAAYRIDHGGKNWAAILGKAKGNGPAIAAVEKIARAIDGIENPDAARGKPALVFEALLRKPAVVRARILQPGREQAVDCFIRFRHYAAVGFALAGNGAVAIAQGQARRLSRGFSEQIEILGEVCHKKSG